MLSPQNEIARVKYFTAKVQPTLADPDVSARQEIYLRALGEHCPSLDVHFGHFLRHRVRMEHSDPPIR